ncbi:hypothetical protein [Massilia sp.]|uniref:hypothetical protein n=1 Tax=Massilia sp. TaxID=1882437 RepID=UPI0028AA1E1F|nr:hypothetical protein [Massilia sp.]
MEQIADPGGVAAMVAGEARTDVRQRIIVDDGIAVQSNANTMSAVEYLRSRNVGRAVIERVLLEPGRRRARQ